MPRREATPAPAEQAAAVPEPDVDLSKVHEILAEIDPHGNLIALLQRTQDAYGYLPEPVVDEIARLSGVRASRIYGIITFYAQFTTVPTGRHKCLVCHGTACHVAGATRITEALEQELLVADGETRADLEFTLGLGRLHGRLLAGARHAHRRRDLRQPQRRRDAQDRAQAARAGRGGAGRCLRCLSRRRAR